MPIRFHCSGCQYLLQVPDDAAGKKSRCPRCQTVADVPLTSQETDDAASHSSSGDEYRLAPPEQTSASAEWSQTAKQAGPLPMKPVASDNPYQSPSSGYDEPQYRVGAGAGTSPLRPTRIVIEDVFRYAWEIYRQNMGILIGVGLMVLGFNIVRSIFANFVTTLMERDGVDPITIQGMVQGLNLMTWPVVVFLEVGQAIVFLKVARGQPVDIGEVFSGGRYFLRALGGSFLYNLAVSLGMCLLIVPGIILALMLWPYLLFIVDRDQGVFESFSSAQEFTNGNKGAMFVVFLAAGAMMLFGVFAFCIGVIFAYPLVMLMTTVAYLMMTGQFYQPKSS